MMKLSSMFLILVVLFAVGCDDNKKLIAEKEVEISRLQKQVDKVKSEQTVQTKKADQFSADMTKQLTELKQKEQVLISENENLTLITLPNGVLFASGSIELTPNGKKAIDEVWKILSQYPERDVSIRGHTDNVQVGQKLKGKYKSNWELSTARALTVLNYVMTKSDAKPNRLSAVGFGEFRPVGDNKTDEGRKKNRRVVIGVGPNIL